MKIKRVLNIEDDFSKHSDIKTTLKLLGINIINHAKNAEDGMRKIFQANEDKESYDLIVLDMNFPLNGIYNFRAGEIVLKNILKLEIKTPIIICSSMPLEIPNVIGCIHYRDLGGLGWDMKEMLKKVELN